MLNAEPEIHTKRLYLRKPTPDDAAQIFERYASDTEVCLYMAWPRHQTLSDTMDFIAFSDAEWERANVGPYLAFRPNDDVLLGSTGLQVETPTCASTGYVFARDAWGMGFATEVTTAMVQLASRIGIERVYACCHAKHIASIRVLQKAGFSNEGVRKNVHAFPNFGDGGYQDVVCYAWEATQ